MAGERGNLDIVKYLVEAAADVCLENEVIDNVINQNLSQHTTLLFVSIVYIWLFDFIC